MNQNILIEIDKLIQSKKIDEAQRELSKLGAEYHKNVKYLFLRSKIFHLNKLYYLAIDTLLIASEFEQKDKIYDLLSEIYKDLGNEELAKKLMDKNLRLEAVNSVKGVLTGIYRKKD